MVGAQASWAAGLTWFCIATGLMIGGVWLWDRSANQHWLIRTSISIALFLLMTLWSYPGIQRQYLTEHPIDTLRSDELLHAFSSPLVPRPDELTPLGHGEELERRARGPQPTPSTARPPDAVLEITHALDPGVSLRNKGGALLREPRYSLTLFDLDTAKWDEKGILPCLRTNIAVFTSSDWLRQGDGFGSFPMFDDSHKPRLGSRIFGWASCTCPACAKERAYLIYLTFGQKAWYYEIPTGQAINLKGFLNPLFGMPKEEQERMIQTAIPESVRQQVSLQ